MYTKKPLVVLECLKDRAFDSADCLRSFVNMRGQLWNVDKGLEGPHKLFETFVFSPLSAHGVKPYFHRKPYLPRGKVTLGNL